MPVKVLPQGVFVLEPLEGRILLSGEEIIPPPELPKAGEAIAVESVIHSFSNPATSSDPAAQSFDLLPTTNLPAVAIEPANSPAPATQPLAERANPAADSILSATSLEPTSLAEPALSPQIDQNFSLAQQTDSLHAPNGPPNATALTLQKGDVLAGTPTLTTDLINTAGLVSPGHSPGVITIDNQGSFSQGPDGTTLIEIGGWNPTNSPAVYDQILVSGNVSFDGTLRIKLLNNFSPVAGQTFPIIKWQGLRPQPTEFANYLGTANIPNNPQLAFVPVYDDFKKELRLEVVDTQIVVPEVENAIVSLSQLLGNLFTVGPSTTQLPLIGQTLQDLVKAKDAFTKAIQNQLSDVLFFGPSQAEVTHAIEGLDGQHFANFDVKVRSVKGTYSTPANSNYRFDVKVTLSETKLTSLLESTLNPIFDFLFGNQSNLTLKNDLELDFTFGKDGLNLFLELHEATARTTVTASDLKPVVLNPPWLPPGQAFGVNASVIFMAFVTAKPDPGQLPNGRILALNPPVLPAFSAFDITKGGSLDATLTLNATVTDPNAIWAPFPLFKYQGTHTLHLVDTDLYDGIKPDMTLIVDGHLTAFGQQLDGVFTFTKLAATTNLLVDANISNLELKVTAGVGPEFRILKAKGTGKLILVNDPGPNQGKMAGKVTLNLLQGPELPNIDALTGDFTLTFSTSTNVVPLPVDDTTTVNIPGGGPYYRVEGDATLDLKIPDIILSGDFLFEPLDPTPGAPNSGDEIVTVGIHNLAFKFVDPFNNPLVTLTNGTGAFVFTRIGADKGMAGQITQANVTLSIPKVSVAGNFSGAINDFTVPFNQTVTINGSSVPLNVPAGKFLRVAATGAVLSIDLGGVFGGPLKATGNFAFEQHETDQAEKVVTVGFDNVTLPFLDGAAQQILVLSNLSGLFVSKPEGLAGEINANTFSFGVPGVISLQTTGSSALSFRMNPTDQPISQSILVGNQILNINLPSGPYLQFRALNVKLNVAGFNLINGDFGFEQRQANSGRQVVTIVAKNVSFNFGDTVANFFKLKDGVGLFVLDSGQFAGSAQITLETKATPFFTLQDDEPAVPDVQTHLNLFFNNNDLKTVNEVFDWEGMPMPVNVPAGHFFEVGGPIAFDIGAAGGSVSMGGLFFFSQIDTGTQKFVGVRAQDFHFDLKAGSLQVIGFKHGHGQFAIFNDGIAGNAALDFDVGLIGASGDIKLDFNTRTVPGDIVAGPINIDLDEALTNYLRVEVNGHIQVGPGSFPAHFTITANFGANTVVFTNKTGPAFSVTVHSDGTIDISGHSLPSFSQTNEQSLFGMIKQLMLWLDVFRQSDVFKAEIPFTGGATLGDAFDLTQLFINKVYSQLASVELPSSAAFFDSGGNPLAAADLPLHGNISSNFTFQLQIGTDPAKNVTVLSGAFADVNALITKFNSAFASAGLATEVVARLNKNKQLVIALTEDELKKTSTLNLTFTDPPQNQPPHPIKTLGFINGQAAVETSRYDLPGFVTHLGQALGMSPAPTYDPNAKLILFPNINLLPGAPLTKTFSFDFGGDLGPLAGAALKGNIQVQANPELHFTLGYDLAALEVPRLLTVPAVPSPSTGQLSGDANFSISINDGPSIPLVLPQAWTLPTHPTHPNHSVEDLAADFNRLFQSTNYNLNGTLTKLSELIIAQKAGQGIAISGLQETDTDGDGVFEMEDANHNGILDPGEDLDANGKLDQEDLNGDGKQEQQLGVVNQLMVISRADDVFATEVGFGIDPFQQASIKYYKETSRSPVKGLFLDNTSIKGSLSVSTPGGISGSINLGFVKVSLDPAQSKLETPSPITIEIPIFGQSNGQTRFYITELTSKTASVSEIVKAPKISGSFIGKLAVNAAQLNAQLPGLNISSGAGVSINIPDVNDLHLNSDPYQPGKTGIFLSFDGLNGVTTFSDVGFFAILQALRAVANNLKQLESFSFLKQKLPFVDLSISDMLNWAGKVADWIEAVGKKNPNNLQALLKEFETQLEKLFNLDPSVLNISLDDTADPQVTTVASQLNATFNPPGTNNSIKFISTNLSLNKTKIQILGDHDLSGNDAKASWDATNQVLTVRINSGVTTADKVLSTVNGLPGTPWTVSLLDPNGTGLMTKTALKLSLNFSTGYGNTIPLHVNLQDLVKHIAGDNSAAATFLQQATSFVHVEGDGVLNVSAKASLKLDFGLDVTDPLHVQPFLYDSTGVKVEAEVLGKNLEFEASLGSVLGIYVKNGSVTLDADGDPDTIDKAFVQLGLKDNNGDGRHYFTESIFNSDNLGFTARAGLTADLPIFAPTKSTPLGSSQDKNGDGYPDNHLVVDIPDLLRLFSPDEAQAGQATIELRGTHNDFFITGPTPNFKVVLVQDPNVGAGAPGAAYNSGTKTVTLTINSGITSAQQVITAVNNALTGSGFHAGPTADDDANPATTTNNSFGKVVKTTIATPDFNSLFDNLDLCAIIDQHAGLLLDGLDHLLGTIQDGLDKAVSAVRLPLIGDALGGIANFIDSFREGLLGDLREKIAASGGSGTAAITDAIKEVFWNHLGPPGLNLLVNPDGSDLNLSLGPGQLKITLDCDDGLQVDLRIKKSLDIVNSNVALDIGVPGFGLSIDGKVQLKLSFDFKLRFGLNKTDGFYFVTDSGKGWVDSNHNGLPDLGETDAEIFVGFEASIPNLKAAGQLAFLTLEASDMGSMFRGGFEVDIKDPNGDGKLTFAELGSSGSIGDLIDANLGADAKVRLHLTGGFGTGGKFPKVAADFLLDWQWSLNGGAGEPSIRFENVGLDLGSYISDFLLPVLQKIHDVVAPFEPIVDIVTAALPIFSDLAGHPVTLLDLWEALGYLSPTSREFIDVIIEIIKLSDLAENLSPSGSIFIPFSAFTLKTDQTGAFAAAELLDKASKFDPEGFLNDMANSGGGGVTAEAKASAGFVGSVGSLKNFHFPLFEHPLEIANLFMGKPVGLIEWDMPAFKADAELIIHIPIFGPLEAQIGGRIGMELNIGFGYDTFGIQKYIDSKDPIDIFDGFYIKDFDAQGHDRDELTLHGQLFAAAVINLVAVTAGVKGGLDLTIGFDLNDPNQDGRVRVSEIVSEARIDPRCIFNIHGQVDIFLGAFLTIDLLFFSIDEEWEFGRFTLFKFEVGCPQPILATPDGGDPSTLYLNIGSRAGDREEIDTTDSSEHFVVKHLSGDATSGESIEVNWNGFTHQFDGVKKIVVENAGEGNDTLDFQGVLAAVDLHGGPGNDKITLTGRDSAAGGSIDGDDGDDTITITGAAENLVISGGAGADKITAGTKPITINGGAGADQITGSPGTDTLNGDAGDDLIVADSGDDTIDGGPGNDDIDAGLGDDKIKAGAGADLIKAGLGNDIVDAGPDDDTIFGGPGNDVLQGGTGDDQIFGHSGVDILIGDTFDASNAVTLQAALNSISFGGGPLPTLSFLGIGSKDDGDGGNDILVGGGNYDVLFGGDGNDFLYGGNFMTSGQTEIIEEDFNDFMDGGRGNDELFGDDAQGRTGDRDTGIAIRSFVWLDQNANGIREENEPGVAGVTVKLFNQSDPFKIETTVTKQDGSFKFTGLDPTNYKLQFTAPYNGVTNQGLIISPINTATDPDADNRAHIPNPAQPNVGETDIFPMSINQTLTKAAAGVVGNSVLTIDDVSLKEGDIGENQAVFIVSLSRPIDRAITVDFTTDDGTATHLTGQPDFEKVTGTITLSPGQQQQQIIVPIIPDKIFEGRAEQFKVKLSNLQDAVADPSLKVLLGDNEAIGTIIGDDPVPAFHISDYVPETVGDNRAHENTPAKFTITLSNPSQQAVTVKYQVTASESFDATGEVHYADVGTDLLPVAPADQLLIFLPGQTQKEVTITLLDDTVDEYDEDFFVELFDAQNATVADGHGVGIILDDDAPVGVSISPPASTVTEGDPLFFTVTLLDPLNPIATPKASGKEVVVTYATSPGSAVSAVFSGDLLQGPDYLNTPNKNTPASLAKLTFAPGQTSKTIYVQTLDADLFPEPDEMFFVNLLSAVDGDIRDNHSVITVKDNDTGGGGGLYPIRFSNPFYSAKETDGTAKITLIRSKGSTGVISVGLFTKDGTATEGKDYDGADFIVTFAANETEKTVEIPIIDDLDYEGDETVLLALRDPTGRPGNASPYIAILTIEDSESPPVISILTPPAIVEGNAGSKILSFDVRSTPAGGFPSVSFFVENVTATKGIDYKVLSTSPIGIGPIIDFNGYNEGSINIEIEGDVTPEIAETFRVTLKNPQGGVLDPAHRSAIGTIIDDEKQSFVGYVFKDSNGNKFFDDGEVGLKNIKVIVKDSQGGVQTVTTDSKGKYTAAVPLGAITIQVDESSLVDKDPVTKKFLSFYSGFELTTGNDNQTVDYLGGGGVEIFAPVGYRPKPLKFVIPDKSDPVGRGGTDDTIFGGPGNDFIDAGAGDDHVIGGHWQTATNVNSPINQGSYDAKVLVYDPVPDYPNTKPLNGYIFGVDSTGLGNNATFKGDVWEDLNGNNKFEALIGFGNNIFFPYEGWSKVRVHLFDFKGNEVDQTSTSFTGHYSFTNVYPGEYLLQFDLPSGYSPLGNALDLQTGRTIQVITVAANQTNELSVQIVKGPPPAAGPGVDFQQETYTTSQFTPTGAAVITLSRGDVTRPTVLVYRTKDGTGIAGQHYQSVQGFLVFQPGDSIHSFQVPILKQGFIKECDTVSVVLELFEPTGKPIGDATLLIQHPGGAITDDDVIQAGDDWDIVLGDSGNIPMNLHPGRFLPASKGGEALDPYAKLTFSGGPRPDVIHGGPSLDYIFGQGANDILAGDTGEDFIDGGTGDDFIIGDYGDDHFVGGDGNDTVEVSRDADFTLKRNDPVVAGKDSVFLHDLNNSFFDTLFTLEQIEHVRMIGGFSANHFLVTGWNGDATIIGNFGDDSLEVTNDTNMKLADQGAPLLTSISKLKLPGKAELSDVLSQVVGVTELSGLSNGAPQSFGFKLGAALQTLTQGKKASLTLASGSIYSLTGIEHVTLIGGPSDNTLDAGNYSGPVMLEGKAGNDILVGGTGDDRFVFDVDDSLGSDKVDDKGGRDTLDFSGTQTLPLTVNLSLTSEQTVEDFNLKLTLKSGNNIDNVVGGAKDDQLTGNALDNVLNGGPGNDTLAGGAGNETYAYNADEPLGAETIIENPLDPGHDMIDLSATKNSPLKLSLDPALNGLTQIVTPTLNLVISGGGIEELIGGGQNDELTGNALDNILRGGPGHDILIGLGGDDFLDDGPGNDRLDGGLGTDSIQAQADRNISLSNDRLVRGSEIDVLANIESATLTGSERANTFDLTGWTGNASIDGEGNLGDKFVLLADADFKVTNLNARDVRVELDYPVADGNPDQTIDLKNVELFELTGGPADNVLDASSLTPYIFLDSSVSPPVFKAAPRGSFTLNGGPGDDTIVGTRGADVLIGGAGDDQIVPGFGDDIVDGGDGTDEIKEQRSAPGTIQFVLDADNLRIQVASISELDQLANIETATLIGGAAGNTFIIVNWTPNGTIRLQGGAGTDQLACAADADIILSSTTLQVGPNSFNLALTNIDNVILLGGPSDNAIDASEFTLGIPVVILGAAGNDTLMGSPAADTIIGNDGDDILIGNGGNDSLNGGAGNDRYLFNADLALGEDKLQDSSGIDQIDFSATQTQSITFDLSSTLPQTITPSFKLTLNASDAIEGLLGGAKADNLTGNILNNFFDGGRGADIIHGGLGTNTIVARANGDWVLKPNSLELLGAGEIDQLFDIQIALIEGGDGDNKLDATLFTGQAVLVGDAGNDTLLGGSGNDVLIGGPGKDLLRGGDGNDTYLFAADAPLDTDTIEDIGGTDTLNFAPTTSSGITVSLAKTSVDQVINSNLSIFISSSTVIENVIGTTMADQIIGNAADNQFTGGGGDDTIDGANGSNSIIARADADFTLTNTSLKIGSDVQTLANIKKAILFGGAGNNILNASLFTGIVELHGGVGNDLIFGGSGDDLLFGDEGNDQLVGGAGNDELNGGAGNDTLDGGHDDTQLPVGDNDVLRGGLGNDRYLFNQNFQLGTDAIVENPSEGERDSIFGAATQFKPVNLISGLPQIMSANLTLILTNPGQVENSV